MQKHRVYTVTLHQVMVIFNTKSKATKTKTRHWDWQKYHNSSIHIAVDR